jgi:hypothetical protein
MADSPDLPASTNWPDPPASADRPDSLASAGWPDIPAMAGTVNLTMPLSTWLGLQDAPGEVTGFCPLTAHDSRHLGTAMADHPLTRWCVTLTGRDGRPVAHGCARPGHGPPSPAPALGSLPHGPAPPDQARETGGPWPPPSAQARTSPVPRPTRSWPRGACPVGQYPLAGGYPYEMVRVRWLYPRAAVRGLPATADAAALDQGQAADLRLPRMPPSRQSVRPRPHHAIPAWRPDLRVQSGPVGPTSP